MTHPNFSNPLDDIPIILLPKGGVALVPWWQRLMHLMKGAPFILMGNSQLYKVLGEQVLARVGVDAESSMEGEIRNIQEIQIQQPLSGDYVEDETIYWDCDL